MVQALPKGDRGELAVEVLTEIGVARIVPWAAARSVAVWRGDRAAKSLARWQATAREAAKQARRAWFPEVDAAGVDRRGRRADRGRAPGAGPPRGGDRTAAGRRARPGGPGRRPRGRAGGRGAGGVRRRRRSHRPARRRGAAHVHRRRRRRLRPAVPRTDRWGSRSAGRSSLTRVISSSSSDFSCLVRVRRVERTSTRPSVTRQRPISMPSANSGAGHPAVDAHPERNAPRGW